MSPSIDRILREKNPIREFQGSVDHLIANNPRRASVLFSICARLEFVEMLQYALKIRVHGLHTSIQRTEYEIDRLATYLTLTCLDIAAAEEFGGSDFHDFPDWTSRQLRAPTLSAPFVSLIQPLIAASDSGAVQKALLSSFKTIKEAYFEDEGVSRRFKRLITIAAPHWLQHWLTQIYIIENDCTFSTIANPASFTWQSLAEPQRLRKVADYLFYLRNQYTHTVNYIPPNEKRYIFQSDYEDKGRFSINFIGESVSKEDNLEWFVALRADLAESDVIRLIVTQRLRAWLGIIDDDNLIANYLQRVIYRRLAYSFLDEMEHNRIIITEWGLYQVRGFHSELSKLSHILLRESAAHMYVTHHRSNYPEQDVSQCGFDNYFSHVNDLNAKLNEFNQHTQTISSDWRQICQEQIPLFQELLSLHQTHELLWCIENMGRDIRGRLEAPYY